MNTTVKQTILNFLADKDWVWVWEIEREVSRVNFARASTTTAQLRVLRSEGHIVQRYWELPTAVKKHLQYKRQPTLGI